MDPVPWLKVRNRHQRAGAVEGGRHRKRVTQDRARGCGNATGEVAGSLTTLLFRNAANLLHAPGSYRECMETPGGVVRYYTVRGHAIRVFPYDQHHWGVEVDGVEIGPRFTNCYGAWAAGVAESYGRDPGEEPRTLAALAARAAARQRRRLRPRVSPTAVLAP
jgi:hypothetical protein